jgi:hypothetical protein
MVYRSTWQVTNIRYVTENQEKATLDTHVADDNLDYGRHTGQSFHTRETKQTKKPPRGITKKKKKKKKFG